MCETVFSEHEARLKLVDPEEDEMQCPNCNSARVESYALDPDGVCGARSSLLEERA